jgi:SAM-dependent methyltransferase
MKASTAVTALRRAREHATGRCPICGHRTVFLQLYGTSYREGLACVRCRSVSRKRHVALVIRDALDPRARTVADAIRMTGTRLHTTDGRDALAASLRGYEGFSTSDFEPGVEPGATIGPQATCQDLERLTFADESFDVLVTEDVLEHVRHPDAAFAEIARVLRPGGRHVFTVPFRYDRPTETRVDTSGDEDVHLMEPEYHGDPIRGRILAYRTFGYDLFDDLRRYGFATDAHVAGRRERAYGVVDSVVFVSRRVPSLGSGP